MIEVSRRYQIIPRLRPRIPHELRRRCCLCRAVAAWRERKRKFKPALPSIIKGNVRYLTNKIEVLTRTNLEFQQCRIMCFTKTGQ